MYIGTNDRTFLCRARSNRRPDREATAESTQGFRRISRHDPRRPSRRYRSPRVRWQMSVQFRISEPHQGTEEILRIGTRFEGQPSAEGNPGPRQKGWEEVMIQVNKVALLCLQWTLGVALFIQAALLARSRPETHLPGQAGAHHWIH